MQGQWRFELRPSAQKRRFTREDAATAIANARLAAIPYEPTRISGTPDPWAWIGPAQDGTELEVIAEVYPAQRRIVVFHLMEARPKVIAKIKKANRKG